MWASVQTRARLPEALLVLLGLADRRPGADGSAASMRVVREIVELRRLGFRFIALADDNFYPVTFEDLAQARAPRRPDAAARARRRSARERFELMEQLARLPDDLVFYTQITMEAAEDPEFLDGDEPGAHPRRAGRRRVGDRRGAEGRLQGLQPRRRRSWSTRLQAFRKHGVHVLGSFIFGLPSDTRRHVRRDGRRWRERADITFAQFVLLTPFPGTVDFEKWAREDGDRTTRRSTAFRSRGTG